MAFAGGETGHRHAARVNPDSHSRSRNSDSRSGSGAGSGVASSKSLPIPQSRVGSDHYNSSDAQNFSLPILTPDSESHSRNGSRTGSRSRIFGIGSEKSGLTFQIFKPTPDFLKVTPETAPNPDRESEFRTLSRMHIRYDYVDALNRK